ncbi:MAG: SgcJ/EcaC family oxidoreductase [Bacteroidetes bacterium]|nr:SgcJ/EcaC family oxidoreductase [Bacteroidota bacterium]
MTVAIAVSLLSGYTTPTRGESTLNKEIRDLIKTYQRGLNEANVNLIRCVYAADAIFIGQPFPTAIGLDDIVALYSDFLSKLDFNVEFDVLDIELSDDLGFIRTHSHGTIAPLGQTPEGSEGNREIFVVKKIDGKWKFYRYIFNADVN